MKRTIPLVICALFRYSRIVPRAGRNDPVKALVRGRITRLVVAACAILTAVILKSGGAPMVPDIPDADLLTK